MKKVYIIIDDTINHDAAFDTYSGAFDDLDAAISAAECEWEHLTDFEKRKRLIDVCKIIVPDNVDVAEAYDYICETGEGWEVLREFRA